MSNVEIVGVYKLNRNGVYEEATLTEGMKAADLASYKLLVAGKDQYGYENLDSSKIALTAAGFPGLQATTPSAVRINTTLPYGPQYMAYELSPIAAYTTTGIQAGTVNLLAVVTTSGQTSSATVEVAKAKKIASLSIGTTTVYVGKANVLEYVAVDTEGNEVTSYEALKALNASPLDGGISYLPANVSFVRNVDGSAKLVYDATGAANVAIATPVPMTFRTPTNVFTNVTFTVMPKCVPTSIIGVDADTLLGVVGLTGEQVQILAKNLIVQDQYGNVMSDDAFAASGVTLKVTNTVNTAFTTATSASISVASKNTVVVDADAINATYGYATMTIALWDTTNNKEVANSSTTVTVKAVAMDDLSNFEITDTGLLVAGATQDIDVTAYAGATLVKVPEAKYTVIGNIAADADTVSVPGITVAVDGYTTKKVAVNVVINNTAGTVVTKELEYSNIAPAVAYVVDNDGLENEVTATTVNATTAKNFVTAITQYSNWTYMAGAMFGDATNARVAFSNLPFGATVDQNNTANATLYLTNAQAGEYTIHVAITYANGVVYEYDLVVNR